MGNGQSERKEDELSIADDEAEKAYPTRYWDGTHVKEQFYCDTDDLQEAYLRGRNAPPADAEVEAVAKAFYEALKPAIDKHDRQVAERAFELGCVAVDAEEHGVGCRFTVGQLEELSHDYGRDAYSVNNPYGRGES